MSEVTESGSVRSWDVCGIWRPSQCCLLEPGWEGRLLISREGTDMHWAWGDRLCALHPLAHCRSVAAQALCNWVSDTYSESHILTLPVLEWGLLGTEWSWPWRGSFGFHPGITGTGGWSFFRSKPALLSRDSSRFQRNPRQWTLGLCLPSFDIAWWLEIW